MSAPDYANSNPKILLAQRGMSIHVAKFPLFYTTPNFAICLPKNPQRQDFIMTIDFKGSHYPKDVILFAVFFYVR